jgi:hypothetical protein
LPPNQNQCGKYHHRKSLPDSESRFLLAGNSSRRPGSFAIESFETFNSAIHGRYLYPGGHPGESRSAGSGAVPFFTGSNRILAVAVTFEPDETLCREERALDGGLIEI